MPCLRYCPMVPSVLETAFGVDTGTDERTGGTFPCDNRVFWSRTGGVAVLLGFTCFSLSIFSATDERRLVRLLSKLNQKGAPSASNRLVASMPERRRSPFVTPKKWPHPCQ